MSLAESGGPRDNDPPLPWSLSPPRTIEELGQRAIAREEVLRLPAARVVFADYGLLQRDFPQLRLPSLLAAHPELDRLDGGLRTQACHRLIDEWLIQNAAFISVAQAGQALVNLPIKTTGETVTVYRPPRYGRAAVRAVTGIGDAPGEGLLDVKGIGVAPGVVPSHRDHGTGLMPVGEALEELSFQRLIDAIFRHAGTQFHALPAYAALDLGFDLTLEPEPRGTFPAGALVRAAHRRWPGARELPKQGSDEHQVLTEIELLLRHYGVTSATSDTFRFEETSEGLRLFFRDHPLMYASEEVVSALRAATGSPPRPVVRLDGINVQTAYPLAANPSRAVLVDFGHYEIRDRFEDPLLSMVADRPMMWGGVISPGDPHFVQPVPELRVGEADWGWVELSPEELQRLGYPKDYNPFTRLELFCLDVALKYRRGELDRSGVAAEIEGLIARTTSSWPGPP